MPRPRAGLIAVICSVAIVSAAYAQWGMGREGSYPPRFPPADFNDGGFTICKIMYTSVVREFGGIGWNTDYPDAARHLMIRASELTRIRVSTNEQHEPNFWVVRLSDDALFQCPVAFASDVGTIGMSQPEADRLREYLIKGGFLWVDDFWGTYAWERWTQEIGKALPPLEYPIVDIPADHPIMRTLHVITGAAGDEHPELAPLGRADLGARIRQRGGPLPLHQRSPRPHHGADVAQHRPRRFLGARGRRARVLLSVLATRLLRRHQRAPVRPHPLSAIGESSTAAPVRFSHVSAVQPTRQHEFVPPKLKSL
jgi:hypothetical protein